MNNLVVSVTMNRAIALMDTFAQTLDEHNLLSRVDRKRHTVYTTEGDSYHFISKRIEERNRQGFRGLVYSDETFRGLMSTYNRINKK